MREQWTFAELIAAGWSEADLEWERLTESALADLAQHRVGEARLGFAAALRLARDQFSAKDPRLAAGLSNQAAAVASEIGSTGSGSIKAAAAQAWAACDGWIDNMTAPRTARSSMFHLRMERLHRPAYEERWRVKGRELLAGVREAFGSGGELELIAPEEATQRIARWHRERPVTLSDPRKLMASVILLAAQERRPGSHEVETQQHEAGRLQQ